MPPKSDYWKYFVVQGVLAICQIQGCPRLNVSLGSVPKPDSPKIIYRWWQENEATFLAKGPAGEALVALAKRWIWLLLSFNPTLLHQVSNTSCNIHGSWEAVQCSRTDNGFKEEQIVTHICWQAALPSRGSPLGHLQTWLEVKNSCRRRVACGFDVPKINVP